MTPAHDLARRAAVTPRATALAWDGGRFTFAGLDGAATVWADRIRDAGAAAGSVVTLCLNPGPDAVAALFGVWRMGGVAVPLHEGLADAEVAYARQIVNSALHVDNHGLHFCEDREGEPATRPRRGPEVPSRVVAFMLTSGSTGPPKALGFGREAFAASAAAITRRLALTPHDRWGLCLSIGHIGGLLLVVRAVMNGSSVRLWPSFSAESVIRAVLAGDVTHLAIVPVMLRRILERLKDRHGRGGHDGGQDRAFGIPETLRCVLVGGAASSAGLLDDAWRAGLPVATTWGMTETASQIATAPPELARRRPGTVGRPLRGVRVATGPDGALKVRGPTLASVVIRGPGRPAEPLRTDPDGWYATRDIGRIDDDGLVWIEGRRDAIIVSGGLNVSPREVERVIETLPGVAEAVVFGVPSDEWGEVVAAVVERDRPELSAADVDRHCRARLARGRCPTRIVVADELPRTLTGKVMRARVAQRYGPEKTET